MTDFTIRDMAVVDGAPNHRGNRLLASFTVKLPMLAVYGCVLIEKSDGIVVAGGPEGRTTKGHKATMKFTDAALTRAITRRAATIYTACTGREVVGVYGGKRGWGRNAPRPDGTSRGRRALTQAEACDVMGIDWMTKPGDVSDAIPPNYTEYVGGQLIDALERAAA